MPFFTRRHLLWQLPLLIVIVIGGMFAWPKKPKETTTVKESVISCPVKTLAQHVADADLILIGSVFAVLPADTGYADVLINDQQVYKGTVPQTGITIVARAVAEGKARDDSGDLRFRSNQPPYLLFLHERTDGRYDTSKCFGSKPLGSGLSPEELNVLQTET